MEELAAIRRCLRGEKDAFAHLVQRYQAQVLALCLRMTGSREDAADVAQQVFINAFRRLDQFDQNLPFRPWLMRIAANECIAFLRRRGRQPPQAGGEALEALTDPGQSAPSLVDLAEDRERVRRAVDQLPDQYRTVAALLLPGAQLHGDRPADRPQRRHGGHPQLHRAKQLLRRLLSEKEVTSDEPHPQRRASAVSDR